MKVSSKIEIALCRFEPKLGRERELEMLLTQHFPTLRAAGLVTEKPHMLLRGDKPDGRPFYVEILPWIDAAAAARAHESEDVMHIWDPMSDLCEFMEFPHVQLLQSS